ncbi:hypothetical protein Bca4012_096634 [Brassica carinata]|uniref:Knottin scorpion toxin-like domain-containing protein n=6 Tax=Brassica TaxID=3705 RepID=A0A0D3DX40_BRAOL|nr:hypothetical protein F2Q69_00063301 [Brassica cretica]KAG2259657.1 hypothetical protein Bca52824_078951 [Brassica carinata]CAF2115125.1 unnamed protein product [Brassica napus]VDD58796.1 unnamed protein product [Brassica oleracea]
MAITKKNLVAFVLTILLVVSYVHCRITSDNISGFGIKKEEDMCFKTSECLQPDMGPGESLDKVCIAFCQRMKFKSGWCEFYGSPCCCSSK